MPGCGQTGEKTDLKPRAFLLPFSLSQAEESSPQGNSSQACTSSHAQLEALILGEEKFSILSTFPKFCTTETNSWDPVLSYSMFECFAYKSKRLL